MKVTYNASVTLEQLLDLQNAVWQQGAATSLAMQGTPAAMQPTAAVRNTYEKRKIGTVSKVDVRAVHNGEVLAFHLSWADSTHNIDHGDNSVWPDAAAVALPLHEGALLMTMGAPGAPLTAWYWRADAGDNGFQVLAQGPGTTQIVDKQQVRTKSEWKDGRWQVVITRPFTGAESPNIIKLEPGQNTRFGVAVWDGASQERGGLKSYSGDWQPLEIAAK